MSVSLKLCLLSLVCSLLFACGGGSSGGGSDQNDDPIVDDGFGGDDGSGDDDTEGPALERVSNTSCLAPAQPSNGNSELSLERVFPNLPALSPLIGLFQAPEDNDTWYALLRDGRIERFDNSVAADTTETVLDITSIVATNGEMGLLGMAIHPNFANNGELYLHYHNNRTGDATTISRFTFSGTLPIDPATEEILIEVDQPSAFHNGGAIHFGPDGYLYVALGDGDIPSTAQDTLSFLGAMLRIDVDSGSPYAIPPDNPFVGDSDFAPEIFAYGFRNPWQWTIDPATGDIWVADVGEITVEEVSLIVPGGNYGWPIMEGSQCTTPGCDQTGLALPVSEHVRPDSGFCSITGGHVWRSDRIPQLFGSFIYGDFCLPDVWRVEPDGAGWQASDLISGVGGTVSFAQSNDGEVFRLEMFGDQGDAAFRFVESVGGTESSIPTTLSQSGCFTSTTDKTKADGVVSYSLLSQLWSDGAEKFRSFAIPDGTSITLNEDGDFIFPVGSVLIKDFLAAGQYIETRLYMRHENSWAGYSYEWRDDGSDADLLSEGKVEDVGEFVHTYPSQAECNACHTQAANFSLGLEASQLNKLHAFNTGSAETDQLGALAEAGFFANELLDTMVTPMAAIDDTTASLELRARSYLHSNCSGCHRPGGPSSILDLRIQTPLIDTGACDTQPSRGDLGIVDARIIAPGNSATSVLLARMQTLGEDRMPPLATMVEDTIATDILAQWIDSLSACN